MAEKAPADDSLFSWLPAKLPSFTDDPMKSPSSKPRRPAKSLSPRAARPIKTRANATVTARAEEHGDVRDMLGQSSSNPAASGPGRRPRPSAILTSSNQAQAAAAAGSTPTGSIGLRRGRPSPVATTPVAAAAPAGRPAQTKQTRRGSAPGGGVGGGTGRPGRSMSPLPSPKIHHLRNLSHEVPR